MFITFTLLGYVVDSALLQHVLIAAAQPEIFLQNGHPKANNYWREMFTYEVKNEHIAQELDC